MLEGVSYVDRCQRIEGGNVDRSGRIDMGVLLSRYRRGNTSSNGQQEGASGATVESENAIASNGIAAVISTTALQPSPEEQVRIFKLKREEAKRKAMISAPTIPVKMWVQQEAMRVFLSTTYEVLTRVPQDVVLYIFSFLNKIQLKQVALVCKDFNRLRKLRKQLDEQQAPKHVWQPIRKHTTNY